MCVYKPVQVFFVKPFKGYNENQQVKVLGLVLT